jgi:membrane protein DedA with SNARE-associated domain
MWMAAGGVLLALLAAGVGIPLPEDLTLLGAGYLVWRGEAPFALMWGVGMLGILAGDTCIYWIGRKLGPRLTRHKWLSHRLTPARLQRVEDFFTRHGAKSIFLARWAAGARGAFYMTAGVMRLPFSRFLLFDFMAACLSVSFWVLLGFRFGDRIDSVRHLVKNVEHVALAAIATVLVAWLLARLLRRFIEGPPEPA